MPKQLIHHVKPELCAHMRLFCVHHKEANVANGYRQMAQNKPFSSKEMIEVLSLSLESQLMRSGKVSIVDGYDTR